MAYLVDLGCFGERIVEDEDEALEFVQTHYPDGVIYSLDDVDDPAIGETPIYENDDESDDFAIGTVYPCKRRVSGAGDRDDCPDLCAAVVGGEASEGREARPPTSVHF